jgi:hypothetical protein
LQSGFCGVHASSGGSGKRWTVQFSYDNTPHYIGTFDTKHEAALAYDRAARQCGEDMPLNYESIAAKGLPFSKNVRPRPASCFYGVSADRKRWNAKITYDNKPHYIGTFDTKYEAALAYDRAARQWRGGYAAELRGHRSSRGPPLRGRFCAIHRFSVVGAGYGGALGPGLQCVVRASGLAAKAGRKDLSTSGVRGAREGGGGGGGLVGVVQLMK